MVHEVAAAGFNDAADYEAARPSYPPEAVVWFVEHLRIAAGAHVVDLAAGTGKLTPGAKYALKHTSNWARALIKDLHYRLDVNTLHRDEAADSLSLNEIGRVTLRTTKPLLFDEYRRNRETGSFILVDEATNDTVAAGMIV